jgi:hypothetical protein
MFSVWRVGAIIGDAHFMWGFLFLFVAGWASYGVYRMLRANERNRRYLQAARDEAPLQLDHLSSTLRRLTQETRMLRISLEAPIRDVADFRQGEFHQAASEDLDGFDNMLMNVSRQLADWVAAIDRLPEHERATLERLGLSAEPIRSALDAEGWAFERRNLHRLGQHPMEVRLRNIVAELDRVETSLQVVPRPYR